MRNLLGTLLAIFGAFWWVSCLLGSFLIGLLITLIQGPDADLLIGKIAAFPSLCLLLMIGDGLLIFGLLMIGYDKPLLMHTRWLPPIPANPGLWLLLRSMRMAGFTLAGLFSCEIVLSILARGTFPWTDVILGMISGSAAVFAHVWIPRLSIRPAEPLGT